MNIPGMTVSHQIIRKECRDNHGTFDAFEEAVRRLRDDYDQLAAKGIADETEIHLALIVQHERHRTERADRIPCEAAVRLSRMYYRGMGEWVSPEGDCFDEEQINELRAEVASDYMAERGMPHGATVDLSQPPPGPPNPPRPEKWNEVA